MDKLLSIAVLTDDDVEEQNRVTLSAIRPARACPLVEIRRNRSARTKRREYLVEQAVRLLRAAGDEQGVSINNPPTNCITSTLRCGWA